MNDRDGFLTESMGEFWHEQKDSSLPWCSCSKPVDWPDDKLWSPIASECQDKNNDFSTWQGFGKLWEWAQRQEWWDDFYDKITWSSSEIEELYTPLENFIKPDRFADAVYDFLNNKDLN